MGEDRSPASGAILELCEEYRLLSDRCAVLDAEFSIGNISPSKRDALFGAIHAATADMQRILNRLAATRSDSIAAVRAKATVIASVLRAAKAANSETILTSELVALVLSVAEEICDLI